MFAIATIPRAAFGWGNLEAHPELTESAARRDERIAAHLREVYGLEQGLASELAVQIGFDDRTDPDITRGGPVSSSRFAQSWNFLPPPMFAVPRVDTQIVLNAACPLTSCLDDLVRQSVLTLLRSGSFGEDNPNLRASHHFHDPIKAHANPEAIIPGQSVPIGNRGLDNTSEGLLGELLELANSAGTEFLRGGGDFRLFGRSALDRAINRPFENPASTAAPENFFAIPDAERYLFESLSAPSPGEREHFLSLHFLAVGSALHLLQDMSSVAHTRNDYLADHLYPEIPLLGQTRYRGATLEGAGEGEGLLDFVFGLRRASTDLLVSLPAVSLASYDAVRFAGTYAPRLPLFDSSGAAFADFWDSPTRLGLAEFTNAHFFSRATVDDRYAAGDPEATSETGYPSPRVAGCQLGAEAGSGSARTFVTLLPRRDLDSGRFFGPESEIPYLSSETVPHLARCGWHAASTPSVIDDSVMRDYLEMLLPLAVDYSAKFLERYFAPRIAVRASGEREFRIENVSDLPILVRASELRAVYDDIDGNRWSLDLDCGSESTVIEIAPSGSTPTHCTLPASLPSGNEPPAVSADFWVVGRGAHGDRGSADPSEFETKGYVTFVAHIQPQLLFHATTENTAFEDEDLRHPIDLFSIPLDLTRSVEPDDVAPTRRNLTADLRAEIDSAMLDLTAPEGEPGGVRIALRSDRDATETEDFFQDVAAPLRAFVFDPSKEPTDPAALAALPSSEQFVPSSRTQVAPLWAADGSAIFYYEDASFSEPERPTKDRLVRAILGDPVEHKVFRDRVAYATSNPDETPDDLPLGTTRQVCRGLEAVAPFSATFVAGRATCFEEAVVMENGQKRWLDSSSFHWEIRAGNVVDSVEEPGKLEVVYTDRIDIASGSIVGCGGSPGTCWQRGGEPSGEPNGYEDGVSWSHDGNRLAFLRDPTGLDTDFGQEIWVADLGDGTARMLMTAEHGDPDVPEWTPDGRWLVFGMALGEGVAENQDGTMHVSSTAIDVHAIRVEGQASQTPAVLSSGLRPFSIGLYAPLVLPSAP